MIHPIHGEVSFRRFPFFCVSSVLADDSGLITQQITINVPKAGTLSSLG